MTARRFDPERVRELREFSKTLVVRQPNRGPHECTRCGVVFGSEAGFTYHQRTRKTKRYSNECLTERLLKRAEFAATPSGTWQVPAWVELWYLDELAKETGTAGAGFRAEAWVA